MINELIVPVLWLGGMAIIFGSILGYASKVFAVEKDPKVPLILDVLPGANCGGCGFPGCEAFAVGVAAGNAKVDSCPVGGASTAEKIGEIMGVDAGGAERMIARVICQGTSSNCSNKFEYYGVKDCKEAVIAQGGHKSCNYACLGFGTCERVCPFDAIHVTEDNIARVDPDKCTACGKCIEACPKLVIDLVPASKGVHVDCNSKDKGKEVKSNCKVGCIGCKVCVKNCPEETIGFEDNLAKIHYDKCTECMVCVEKCPTKAITAEMIQTKQKVS